MTILKRNFVYYWELPDGAGAVINMYRRNDKLWVETESGKRYVFDDHPESKPIRADLRLVQ